MAGASTEVLDVLDVLAVLVDTRDHRHSGSAVALTTYRDAKHAALTAQICPHWQEVSFDPVDAALTMRAQMLAMGGGAFDDCFNRE
jgi:uncharacterized membrane protein